MDLLLWMISNHKRIAYLHSHANKESKKISNDQELIQSDPISCPQNQREIAKYIN